MNQEQIAEIERHMREEHRKDLEALARLKRFLPQNGLSHPVPAAEVEQIDLDEDFEDPKPVTSLRSKIGEVLNENPSVRWTTQKVLARLREDKFPLKAQKPIYSVGQALQKLVTKGTIRIIRHGTGSDPNVYKGKGEDLNEASHLAAGGSE
jgi:hypothetical protein